MTKKDAENLLKIASEQVSFGIYAVEQDGKISLENIHCKSLTQLKEKRQEFRKAGFKVYLNGL